MPARTGPGPPPAGTPRTCRPAARSTPGPRRSPDRRSHRRLRPRRRCGCCSSPPHLSTPPGATPATQVATTAATRATPATTGAAPGSPSRRAESNGSACGPTNGGGTTARRERLDLSLAERDALVLGSDDDADHDRGLVAIVPPTVRDTVDDQPVAGCQADLGVFEHEDSFTGELHEAVDGSGRMQSCEARDGSVAGRGVGVRNDRDRAGGLLPGDLGCANRVGGV